MPGLGRKYEEDPRDFKLTRFLEQDPLIGALASVQRSWLTTASVKNYLTIATPRLLALGPVVPPSPTPPGPASVTWADDSTLDQGNEPSCVAFGWSQWGNTLPVDDNYVDDDGHNLYAYIKSEIDHDTEDGTTVRSGAKAMQARGRLSAYAFAATDTLDEVIAWLQQRGSLVWGTVWDVNTMMDVDEHGFIAPASIDGAYLQGINEGHAYLNCGYLPDEEALLYHNSWGEGWGIEIDGHGGYFKMRTDIALALLQNYGEACTSVENPL